MIDYPTNTQTQIKVKEYDRLSNITQTQIKVKEYDRLSTLHKLDTN